MSGRKNYERILAHLDDESQFLKNENDCGDRSIFSDSESSFTSLDLSANNYNITLEIDKKIDDLIIKNIQKDLFNLKISADMAINTTLIFVLLILFLFSVTLCFVIDKVIKGYACICLIALPILFLVAFNIYQNTYLKYSNVLAKSIVKVLGYYLFFCFLGFISMIILLKNNVKIMQELDYFYYFIPIFAVMFITTGFWLFLYQGYLKIGEHGLYLVIFFNILALDIVALFVYFKLTNTLGWIKWINIIGILSAIQGFNFFYFFFSNQEGRKNTFLISNNEIIDHWEYYQSILDILLNIAIILFFPMLGFYLDNNLKKQREIMLFALTWMICIILIVKLFQKNQKIRSFFEWKKMSVI